MSVYGTLVEAKGRHSVSLDLSLPYFLAIESLIESEILHFGWAGSQQSLQVCVPQCWGYWFA